MDCKVVRELIGRWEDGATTLAEEAALREFFTGAGNGAGAKARDEDLPADLQPYRVIFNRLGPQNATEKPTRRLILHTAPATPPRPTPTWAVRVTRA